MLTFVVSPRPSLSMSSRPGLEDAPTTLFDDDEPASDAEPSTVLETRDPWSAVGVELGGDKLSQYRLLQVIAQGGPVDAFLAEHLFLGRHVLVKILSSTEDRDCARAFLAEATALWQLGHPSFPAVLEYGTDVGGRPFVIMEYSAGASLTERLAAGPIPAALALDLAEQIASAMTTAHGRGVAHGALATDAIYLCPESALRHGIRVKIADFAAGVPSLALDSTRDAVERAIRAARPADDLAAAGELFAEIVAAIDPGSMPETIAQPLADLLGRMRAVGEVGPSMVEVARELRRLALELGLAAQLTRTGVVVARRDPGAVSLIQGAAVFVGGIALAAVLGAIL
jgi:hypothetical protein